MNNIQNFHVRSNRVDSYQDYHSAHLRKYKWLTKFVNFLLRLTKAQKLDYAYSIERVSIDTDILKTKLIKLMHENKMHGKQTKTFVLGYDQYEELICKEQLPCLTTSTEMNLFGVRVVLNPNIDGCVALDF